MSRSVVLACVVACFALGVVTGTSSEVASLTASPTSVAAGQSSTLTLTLTTPTGSYHNIFINGVRPACFYATTLVCTMLVTPAATTTYQASATNGSDVPYTMPSVTVTVTGMATPLPTPTPTPIPTGPLPAGGLVQASNLVELGSFTTPSDVTGIWQGQMLWEFSYANGSIAFNPANQSLFVVGHDWGQHVAEMTIPSPGGTASMIQPFGDALDGKLPLIDPDPETTKIGGLFVTGSWLLVSGYTYYDGTGSATASHFSRATNLAAGTVTGPLRVGTLNPGFYGGYFAAIPSEWQAALGGDLIVGLNGIPIVSRTSYGPAAFAIWSTDLVAGVNPTAAAPLVYYDQNHQTLGAYGVPGVINPLYNGTAKARGALIPPGSSSLLFFGSTSLGPYCYGQGTSDQSLNLQPVPGEPGVIYCYDPASGVKGEHGYPYSGYVWAYDLKDLAAVRAGVKQPWEVTPYASWALAVSATGAAYDAASGRLFLSTPSDSTIFVHVFKVQ